MSQIVDAELGDWVRQRHGITPDIPERPRTVAGTLEGFEERPIDTRTGRVALPTGESPKKSKKPRSKKAVENAAAKGVAAKADLAVDEAKGRVKTLKAQWMANQKAIADVEDNPLSSGTTGERRQKELDLIEKKLAIEANIKAEQTIIREAKKKPPGKSLGAAFGGEFSPTEAMYQDLHPWELILKASDEDLPGMSFPEAVGRVTSGATKSWQNTMTKRIIQGQRLVKAAGYKNGIVPQDKGVEYANILETPYSQENIAAWGNLSRAEQKMLEYVRKFIDVTEQEFMDLLNWMIEVLEVDVYLNSRQRDVGPFVSLSVREIFPFRPRRTQGTLPAEQD